MKSVFTDSN